ncbi:ankyrin repeat family protein [Striga asiatica]|uniref:Ankyrin repeat family protein n=1 Tax=Striga asiatica TaxID=4170 RepID=A0A5A7QH54_STRAF|nr:ankyrin repeat family protein [Striga asiatica]
MASDASDALAEYAQLLDDGKGLAQTVAAVKDANKRGPLHFAAREGQIEVCKYLIKELKMDINTKDEDGETPLIHAARQGHTAAAKYLVDSGADPSIASDLGATALHHSAGIGDVELLKFLLSEGVNSDLQSDAGCPLIWAAGHAQQDSVKVLLEHNADPNCKTEDDITPLLSAVAAGSVACLELLIKAGAAVNVTAGGATPLHIAADGGSPEIINCLLQAGADPNVTDEDGLKPIQVAAARGNKVAVEILFPLTSAIASVREWSIDGILQHMQHKSGRSEDENNNLKESNKLKDNALSKQDMPEYCFHCYSLMNFNVQVTAEAKKKAAEAKARGDDAFRRKDFMAAIDAYTQVFIRCYSARLVLVDYRGSLANMAFLSHCLKVGSLSAFRLWLKRSFLMHLQAIDLDPTDATLLSNRSLCWIRLGQADHALADAKACKALRPDWPKACYREGAALRLLQKFEEAANAFYDGVLLNPENMELVTAFREAVEAGRKFHGTDQPKP